MVRIAGLNLFKGLLCSGLLLLGGQERALSFSPLPKQIENLTPEAARQIFPNPDSLVASLILPSRNRVDDQTVESFSSRLRAMCEHDLKKMVACALPDKIDRYRNEAKAIFGGTRDIRINRNEEDPFKPWDIRDIGAGNFIVIPNQEFPEQGIEQVVDFLLLRQEIDDDLSKARIEFRAASKTRGVHAHSTLIPSIQAYLYSSSPLGAAYFLFRSIRCEMDDGLCLLVQERVGAVAAHIVSKEADAIIDFKSRLQEISADHETAKMRRLGLVMSFARDLSAGSDAGIQKEARQEMIARLSAIVADGVGGYVDFSYQNLARDLFVLAEASLMQEALVRLAPYENSLSESEKRRVEKRFSEPVRKSLEALERSFRMLGLDEESGLWD
ncbi:MAG: hypothetical protein RBT63_00970 [Bdellovibrionales bacterium]|nr:hypothetical protein [Bdellovibrionales bacterium]